MSAHAVSLPKAPPSGRPKAKRELGFSARLSIKRTILDFLGIAPEDGATDVARAQA